MDSNTEFQIFDSLGCSFSFCTNAEYLDKRKQIDDYVYEDEHIGDRKEKWILLKFFDRFIENITINETHIISKSEQPDFLLSYNHNTDGFEITESTDEEYRAAWSHAKKRELGEYPINTYFGKEKKVGKKNLYKTFQKPNESLRGMPVFGDYGERQCAQSILDAIDKKVVHLNKYAYQDLKDIELIVYENGPYSVYATFDDLQGRLHKKKNDFKKYSRQFKRVHVLKGFSVLFDIFGQSELFLEPRM